MLSISNEQLLTISNSKHNAYLSELSEYCMRNFPSELGHLRDQSVYQFVNDTVAKAKTFGLEKAKHLSRFTLFSLQVLPDTLSQLDWLEGIMLNTANNPDTKLNELSNKLIESHYLVAEN